MWDDSLFKGLEWLGCLFAQPTAEHIAKLSGTWTASYSGGKDSTSLVTWIEWLRRTKQIDCPQL